VFLNRSCIVGAFVTLLVSAWTGLGWLVGPDFASLVLASWLVVGTLPAEHHPYPELNPVRRLFATAAAWLLLVQVVGNFVV
jgi:hypothetical protein